MYLFGCIRYNICISFHLSVSFVRNCQCCFYRVSGSLLRLQELGCQYCCVDLWLRSVRANLLANWYAIFAYRRRWLVDELTVFYLYPTGLNLVRLGETAQKVYIYLSILVTSLSILVTKYRQEMGQSSIRTIWYFHCRRRNFSFGINFCYIENIIFLIPK